MTVAETCTCRKSRIDLTGRCTICGLERLHVMPKVAPTVRLPQPSDVIDMTGEAA